MEINWFTVIAQIINFFILIWLLKRFLYKPILKAIDERESNIAAQLKDAEVKKAEAKKDQEDFQQKNVTFDLEKKERTDKMVLETKEERQKLLDQARKDAEALAKHLEKSAKEQQLNQHLELNKKIREEVFAVSRKALSDLASVDFEEQLTQVFIKRLKALKEKELKQLKAAFKGSADAMFVRSALKLPKKQQNELKKAIDTILDADTALKFEKSPALIGGIELSTQEYKLAWSISEYLSAFENEVAK
jgi:F-type H+-transporting ATPase subunit b